MTGSRSLKERFAKGSVEWSEDLQRILALPRRSKPELEALALAMSSVLKKPEGTQVLRAVQAWALSEGPAVEGLIGGISTGRGKTLIGMLMPMVWPWIKQPDGTRRPPRAVLFIPPDLREQFAHDWESYGAHWKLPNLAGGKGFQQGLPVLHVVAYSELSHEKSSNLLNQINPDIVMGDEISALRNFEASRTIRMRRFFAEHPDAHFLGWDATLMGDTVEDLWLPLVWALDVDAPVPLEGGEMQKWSAALAPAKHGEELWLPGELSRLCEPGESPRRGFRRRLVQTHGVVFTADNELGIPLYFTERKPPEVPEIIHKALVQLRKKPELGGWKRPDGEELRDITEVTAVAKQLALGFYLFWRFTSGTNEQIEEWFTRRQAWNREVRSQVRRGRLHMDSPTLCENAAQRWYDGGCEECGRAAMQLHLETCSSQETQLLWDADSYRAWREVEHTITYVVEVDWVSDWLLEDAAKWALGAPGIVWVKHPEFGQRLAKLTKLPFYGGGKESNRAIIGEDGSRSIICSVQSNERGKNLQAHNRNLLTTFPSSSKTVEQVVGRSYREGQKADKVTVDYYLHIDELERSKEKAIENAESVQELTGGAQKLCFGQWGKAA